MRLKVPGSCDPANIRTYEPGLLRIVIDLFDLQPSVNEVQCNLVGFEWLLLPRRFYPGGGTKARAQLESSPTIEDPRLTIAPSYNSNNALETSVSSRM